MIRTTFFLRKVSWMTMKKPTGETDDYESIDSEGRSHKTYDDSIGKEKVSPMRRDMDVY